MHQKEKYIYLSGKEFTSTFPFYVHCNRFTACLFLRWGIAASDGALRLGEECFSVSGQLLFTERGLGGGGVALFVALLGFASIGVSASFNKNCSDIFRFEVLEGALLALLSWTVNIDCMLEGTLSSFHMSSTWMSSSRLPRKVHSTAGAGCWRWREIVRGPVFLQKPCMKPDDAAMWAIWKTLQQFQSSHTLNLAKNAITLVILSGEDHVVQTTSIKAALYLSGVIAFRLVVLWWAAHSERGEKKENDNLEIFKTQMGNSMEKWSLSPKFFQRMPHMEKVD